MHGQHNFMLRFVQSSKFTVHYHNYPTELGSNCWVNLHIARLHILLLNTKWIVYTCTATGSNNGPANSTVCTVDCDTPHYFDPLPHTKLKMMAHRGCGRATSVELARIMHQPGQLDSSATAVILV